MRLKNLALSPYTHLILLVLIVFVTFNRTLGSYFIADDFGEVAYVSRIAAGDLGLLWSNFAGNYMQIASMSVWRPWLLVSLLIDYLIWGANPLGYYLTNYLFYSGTCLALYIFIRSLTTNWCKARSALAAFFTALIFALSPLHCEAITFVVGRVDIICAFFYLVCLILFTRSLRAARSHFKTLTILSVVSFWLAMWTKEMAIGAPVLALAIALFWGRPALQMKKSLHQSAPLLISVIVYFILRYLALGTILGGYTQGIGDAQAAGALSHWLDPDTATRLFFPLPYSIYGSNHIFHSALTLIYAMLAVLLLLRLASLSVPLGWILFLPLWLATTLAPIYKLWGIGYDLEGARFVFFATMPLAAALPLLLFAPHSSGSAAKGPAERLFRRAFAALSLIALLALSVIYGKIAARHNLEWVHAGKEVREFAQQTRALAAQGQRGNTIILGIPKRRGSAEMILNGTTFKILLQPPFTQKHLDDHFLTFDPIIFGNSDFINAQRLKDSLAQPDCRLQIWSAKDRVFKPISLSSGHDLPQFIVPSTAPPCFLHTLGHAIINSVNGQPMISKGTAGDGLYFSGLDLSPLDADFLEVTLTCMQKSENTPLALKCSWKEDDPERKFCVSQDFINEQSKEKKVYLRLSQNFRWYSQQTIDWLFLELPPQTKLIVHAVRLLKASAVCPSLSLFETGPTPKPATISSIGVYPIEAGAKMELRVALPPALQTGQAVLEISKANAFFENFGDSNHDQAVETIIKVKAAPSVSFPVPPLKASGNYELAAYVTDNSGRRLGATSDPIVVRPYEGQTKGSK